MKHKLWVTLLIVAVLVLGGLHDAFAGDWTAVAPSPVPMAAPLVQCADDPDSFYLVSGILRQNVTTKFLFRYDILEDTWTRLKPMPDAMRGTAVACYQGKIYVAGGTDFAVISNILYIYDIATNTWSSGATMPDPNFGGWFGVWKGKLYLVGGTHDLMVNTDRVDVYDITSNTWTADAGTPMPYAAWGYFHAQVGSYLYVVGGFGDEANLTTTQRYDMRSNKWSLGPTFTSQRATGGIVAAGTHLYALGGDIENDSPAFQGTDLVEVLDLSAWPGGAWVDAGFTLPAVYLLAPAAYTEVLTAGEIWVAGGGLSAYESYDEVYYRPLE